MKGIIKACALSTELDIDSIATFLLVLYDIAAMAVISQLAIHKCKRPYIPMRVARSRPKGNRKASDACKLTFLISPHSSPMQVSSVFLIL